MSGTIFIQYLWQDPRYFFSMAFFVIFSICCHEYMHAWTALKLGDPTAAQRGHLTLNPLKQMGWWSLFLFCIFGLAWGSVPVIPGNLTRRRHGAAMVALAGPLTNLVLSLIFILLTALMIHTGNELENPVLQIIFQGAVLNMALCLLNILPIPGFDGFAALADYVPKLLQRMQSEMVRGIFFATVIVLFSCIGYLFRIAQFLAYCILLPLAGGALL